MVRGPAPWPWMKEGRSGAEMLAMAQEYHETRARVAFATKFAATSSEQQPRGGGMVKSRSQPANLRRATGTAAQQHLRDDPLHDTHIPPQSTNAHNFRPISAEARRLFRVPTQYRMPVHDMTEHNERLFKEYNIFGHAPPGPRFVC